MKVTILIFYFLNYCRQINTTPPHIILIVADDMGWNDCGHHGSNQILTANLDAMTYHGVPLTNFVSQHICTPSRAALLTGMYPIHTGMQGMPLKGGEDRHLSPNITTLPKLLKQLNYSTHLVGKWHLGASYRSTLPSGHGFDSHFGYYNGYMSYFDYIARQENISNTVNYDGFDLHHNIEALWGLQGNYATDLFTKKSEEIILGHDTAKPLFLQISHLAGHTGKDGVDLEVRNESEMNRRYYYIDDLNRRRYADIISVMDESIGRIFAALTQNNMLSNSIVVFLSDNGAQTIGLYQNYGSNWPLRGLKFTMFQGAVRTPATIFSPLIKNRGIATGLFHITDLVPTLYRAAAGKSVEVPLDGFDQWGMISQKKQSARDEVLINIDEVKNYSAFIGFNGRYKLVQGCFQDGEYDGFYGETGRGTDTPDYNYDLVLNSLTNIAIEQLNGFLPLTRKKIDDMRGNMDLGRQCKRTTMNSCCDDCLFDLVEDPCESKNIKEEQKDVYLTLKGRIDEYRRNLVPQTNKPVDPASDPKLYNNTWCTWKENQFCAKTPITLTIL